MSDFKYQAICHTACYWLETYWEPGEVYQGDIPPNKHFSQDGKIDRVVLPRDAAADPRSNDELREFLKSHNVRIPNNAARKTLWGKVNAIELAAEKDALTATKDKFEAVAEEQAKKPPAKTARKK